MNTFLLVIHLVISLAIIGLVLMQHGKGADVGASFGSGASNTIFGSQGSGSFLAKATMILGLLFAINSIAIIKLSPKATADVVDVDTLVLPESSLESAPESLPGDKPRTEVSSGDTMHSEALPETNQNPAVLPENNIKSDENIESKVPAAKEAESNSKNSN